jgi:2-methylcitrate dehydratase PrpD
LPTSLYRPVRTGDTARNTYLGHAAVLGRMAAESVAAGITAPADAIEDYRRVTGRAGRAEPAGLEGFQILAGYFKEYAAVRHVHYAARAALELRSVTAVEDITSIEVWTYPEAIRYCGVRHPDTPLQAQFSLSFGVAAMLRWGRLDPGVYRYPDFGDPLLRDLERKVIIRAPGDWAPGDGAAGDWADTRAARLSVTDSTGRVVDATVRAVRGDESLPWSEADLVGKFLNYSGPSLGFAGAEVLAEHVLRAPLHAKVLG